MHGQLEGPHGLGGRWRTCDLRMRTSDDAGETWSDVQMIDAKWGQVPRCKPIRMQSGGILFGTEYDDGHSRIWLSEDDCATWQMVGRVDGERNQHPTLIEKSDGSVLALLRPCGGQGYVLKSESQDGGRTWMHAECTELASPFAALDAVKLSDGRLVLAWNRNPDARNPLTLALSEDEGKTWPYQRDLVTGEGSFHYPEWIAGQGEALQPWDGRGERL